MFVVHVVAIYIHLCVCVCVFFPLAAIQVAELFSSHLHFLITAFLFYQILKYMFNLCKLLVPTKCPSQYNSILLSISLHLMFFTIFFVSDCGNNPLANYLNFICRPFQFIVFYQYYVVLHIYFNFTPIPCITGRFCCLSFDRLSLIHFFNILFYF